jgi:tryptophanyl-tRNA synthetase
MSLRDGTKKMSKSDLSDMSRINMTDTAEIIAQKIRKAKTDPDALPSNPDELAARPEADNLLTLYAALTDTTKRAALARFAGTQFSLLKSELTEAAVQTMAPIAARMTALMTDTPALDAILRDGADKADAIAQPILADVKKLVGFLPR